MKVAAKTAVILIGIAAIILFFNCFVQHKRSIVLTGYDILELSAALESYKNDHGHYPTDPGTTEQLRPNATYDPAAYEAAAAYLYRALFVSDDKNQGSYLPDFGTNRLRTDTKNGVTRFIDPWGNYYGYSTFKSVHPDSPDGNNSSFDLWSTAGNKKQVDQSKWAKNW